LKSREFDSARSAHEKYHHNFGGFNNTPKLCLKELALYLCTTDAKRKVPSGEVPASP